MEDKITRIVGYAFQIFFVVYGAFLALHYIREAWMTWVVPKKKRMDEKQLGEAMMRAWHFENQDIRVTHVEYDPVLDAVGIHWVNRRGLATGTVAINRKALQGLENATLEQLQDIEISPSRTGLHWPQLDADHYVPGLLAGVYGTKKWMESL